MCYVVKDFEHAKKQAEDTHSCVKKYESPDGKKILIGAESFRVTEILFTPGEGGKRLDGV
jgi:hypothetical protein